MSDPGPFAALPRAPVVLQVLPRLNAGGGVERGTVDVAAAIVAAGGKALVASAEGPLTRELLRAGARHIALPLARKGPLAIWRNARKLAEIIAAEAVDIVHARSRAPAWSAWLACRRTGAHFVTTYHGTYNEGLPGKRRYNAIMARGERVIAISRFIAEHLIARHGTDPAWVRVIPRGVDPVRFDPARTAADRWMALARRWGLPDGAPLVLLPGRLTRWKGQLVAVEAMARIQRRDAVLVLAGDDEGRSGYRTELEDRIKALDLLGRVRLVGHCDDMPAAMMLASVVLSASTDPEAFGRVAVEAQAMGRPVIATDHGGARETVIAGETGLLVPPNDANALAAAIDQALALTEPERAALAFRARENVLAQFTRARMCADTLAIYAELMETGAVAADRGP